MITLLFFKMCWATSWFHLIKSFSLSCFFVEKMMKFNIRKENFNIMTQKTSVMTSPHHMTRWWKWRVHYSDLSVSFSWLIMSGNEGITVEGGGSKASPPLGHRKQKKRPVWIGLSPLCSPSPIRNEVSPGEDTRLRSNFPCGCFGDL